jgi:hypothetical protein
MLTSRRASVRVWWVRSPTVRSGTSILPAEARLRHPRPFVTGGDDQGSSEFGVPAHRLRRTAATGDLRISRHPRLCEGSKSPARWRLPARGAFLSRATGELVGDGVGGVAVEGVAGPAVSAGSLGRRGGRSSAYGSSAIRSTGRRTRTSARYRRRRRRHCVASARTASPQRSRRTHGGYLRSLHHVLVQPLVHAGKVERGVEREVRRWLIA